MRAIVPPSKHGPNRASDYFSIHSTVMQRFIDQGFVEDDTIVIIEGANGTILMDGRIYCAHGVRIDVLNVPSRALLVRLSHARVVIC
jgi:hypothetical protein